MVSWFTSSPAYMPSTAFAVTVISFFSPTPTTPSVLDRADTIDFVGAMMRIAEPVASLLYSVLPLSCTLSVSVTTNGSSQLTSDTPMNTYAPPL